MGVSLLLDVRKCWSGGGTVSSDYFSLIIFVWDMLNSLSDLDLFSYSKALTKEIILVFVWLLDLSLSLSSSNSSS